jgi:hypothetical protein
MSAAEQTEDTQQEQQEQQKESTMFSNMRGPLAHLIAYVALVLAIIALILVEKVDEQRPQDKIAQLTMQVQSLEDSLVDARERLTIVEERPGTDRAVVDALIADVASKVQYLQDRELSEEQRQALQQAFSAGK